MPSISRVSVVLIFLNEERFLADAIDSVVAQTFKEWELLLVDDGSTDRSSSIAQSYADRWPNQIRYLEHSGHGNRGMSASRNAGAWNAHGQYLAFMDADDIWLPNKLMEQVAMLEANPEVGMVFGQAVYWYSWNGLDGSRPDYIPPSGFDSDTIIRPPEFIRMCLSGSIAVPCPSSIIIRRPVLEEVAGFEEQFRGIHSVYEDQAFYGKIALVTPVIASNDCWIYYRLHPDASTAVSKRAGRLWVTRDFYLRWLTDYFQEKGVSDSELWKTLHRELWKIYQPWWLPQVDPFPAWLRWGKKWVLRFQDRLLPRAVIDRIWAK